MFDTVHACTPNINSTPLKKNVCQIIRKLTFLNNFKHVFCETKYKYSQVFLSRTQCDHEKKT